MISSLLADLAACLCDQLCKDGLPEPCFCGVLPGAQVAYDYGFCDGEFDGMAWTRLITSYPAAAVGRVSTDINNCGSGIGVDIELGVMRRAPTLDDQGNPPTEADQLASSNLQVADMMAMWRAVSCCNAVQSGNYILREYRPHGPMGGIVGGTFTVMVAL